MTMSRPGSPRPAPPGSTGPRPPRKAKTSPSGAAPPSEDLAFWRRAGEKLLQCLEQLPLPQRSAFLLHHDDGLALDEVAKALEVGFETAKTRLRYAMSKLRACMGAHLAPFQEGAP